MIRFKKMKPKEVTKDFLNEYVRYQVTTKVKRLEDGIMSEKDVYFEENWDELKKERISSKFAHEIRDGSTIIMAAFDGDKLVGFANLNKPLFNSYINLQY